MYVGHIGIALGMNGWRRSVPLVALLLAAQGPDWIDLIFAAGRISSGNVSMWSHSIPSALIVALVLASVTLARRRSAATAAILAAAYLSHLPADYITGRKPLFASTSTFGLSLYDRPLWDFAAEAIVIVVGWWLWRRSFPPDRRNRPAAWLLVAGLITIQAAADLALYLRAANTRLF
jgi:hypothetical protein